MKRKTIWLACIAIVGIVAATSLTFGAGQVLKSLIGMQDLALWDGTSTKTFTRTSSSGYSLTMNKLDWNSVDILNVYGGGVNRTKATIDTALAAVGTTNKVAFWLSPGTWTIGANLTTAAYSNVTFIIPPGVTLSHSTYTIVFGAPFEAGYYPIFSGTGKVTIPGEIKVDWFGTTAAYIQQACEATPTLNPTEVADWSERPNTPSVIKFRPGGTYTVAAEIDCELGRNVKIDMAGAYFTGTYDGTWFNLQDTNQYSVANSWNVGPSENIVVAGPAFMINSGTNSASLAFKLYGCTNCSIEQIKMDGFYKGIELGKSENLKIHDNIIANATYGIHHPEFTTETGGDSDLDGNSSESTPWYSQNIRIFHNQINPVNPTTTGGVNAIRIDRQVKGLRIWENGGGRIWDQYIYLGNSSYLAADFEEIEIRGNHYENMRSPVLYTKNNHSHAPFRGLSITSNNITAFAPSDNSSFEIYHIENADGVRFDSNKYNFWRNTGGYTIYDIDENCTSVTVGGGESYLNKSPSATTLTYFSYDCDREEITWEPQIRNTWKNLPSYVSEVLTNKSTITTIDLATEMGSTLYPDLLPKSALVRVQVEDSNSTAAGTCYVSVRKDSSNVTYESVFAQLAGTTSERAVGVEGWVPVNTDGTIYMHAEASGNSTMTVTIAVKQLGM